MVHPRLHCAVVEELHHLGVEATAEPRVLGEVLLLRDLHMAHVAEQLEVVQRVRAALGHGLDAVRLRVGESVAAGLAFLLRADVEIRDGLLGHVDAAPVHVLIHHGPHETGHLLAVVVQAEAGPGSEELDELVDARSVRGDLEDMDDHSVMLRVLPLVRQPDAIALDGAVVLEHRSGLQPALAQLQLHRLHVLGVEGDRLAGLDGRLEPFRSELAHLLEARPAELAGVARVHGQSVRPDALGLHDLHLGDGLARAPVVEEGVVRVHVEHDARSVSDLVGSPGLVALRHPLVDLPILVDHVAGIPDELAELDDDGRGDARLSGRLDLARRHPSAHREAVLVLGLELDEAGLAHLEEGVEEAQVASLDGYAAVNFAELVGEGGQGLEGRLTQIPLLLPEPLQALLLAPGDEASPGVDELGQVSLLHGAGLAVHRGLLARARAVDSLVNLLQKFLHLLDAVLRLQAASEVSFPNSTRRRALGDAELHLDGCAEAVQVDARDGQKIHLVGHIDGHIRRSAKRAIENGLGARVAIRHVGHPPVVRKPVARLGGL